MKLEIGVNGELVRQGLEDLQAEIPKIGRRRLRTVMNRIVRIMQAYPAERPGQTYQRTGRMFRSWKVVEITDKKYGGYNIENTARGRDRRRTRYPVYVVGGAYGTRQAWMHRNRWPVFRDVVDEEIKKLPRPVADEIVMVARRKGFEAKVQ